MTEASPEPLPTTETAPPQVKTEPAPAPVPPGLVRRMKAAGGAAVRAAGRLLAYPLRRPGRFLALCGLLAVIGLGAAVPAAHLWHRHHREAARRDLDRYHNAEAMRHLEVCLRLKSRDPETLLLAARAARRLGQPDQAEGYLNRYEELRGTEDDAFILERLLLRVERGEGDSLTHFFDTRLRQNHPDSPLILEALASYFLRSYRLNDAQAALHMWLEREPDNTQALFFQARVFELRQNASAALASYGRVVELDPEMERARLRLTAVQLQLGRAAEALPHVKFLLSRRPDDPEVRVRLARCQLLLGQPADRAEAERILDDVLERQPDYPPALAERGKLARQAGQLEQAEALLRRAALLDPDDHAARYQLYLCLNEAGKTAAAREEFERLQQKEADFKKMQQILLVEMQHTPHDPGLHYEVAQIAFRAGLIRESAHWLLRALKEDPHYGPAHRALADYYEGIGNSAQAAFHREQARRAADHSPSGPAPR